MKLLRWMWDNAMLLVSIILLTFIPLYPKLPLIGVEHTWVYIRLEDFLVTVALALFGLQLVFRKTTLKTPLTLPIIIFWVVGALSTAFAVVFLFPHLANVFPNVAFFNYARRIEYLSVFFIGYHAVRHVTHIRYIVACIALTLLLVSLYGFGQRLSPSNFPAFLTMNEEFAKGIPLELSSAARIPSTFAGHYDLAAYLVLVITLLGSMVIGFKNIFIKILLFLISASGLVLLLMTASRVSFFVYLFSISFMLILQKQKKFIIPIIILSIITLNFFQGISNRFGSTISQVDLVVDARTGKAVGVAKTVGDEQKIIVEEQQSTGEDLPQGSGYISFPSAVTQQTVSKVLYKRALVKAGTSSAEVTNIQGNFVVKKVFAYDVSFTTRFQGEWPRAMEAFLRNPLLGSGYSSINLATDNNYLRILGEVGALGMASFLLIFIVLGIFARKVVPDIQDASARSFVLGTLGGIFGLGLNAILIDVFEASKVAFVLWLVIGITAGVLHLYQRKKIDYKKALTAVLTSHAALFIYMLLGTITSYAVIFSNYFVGDDFTWLRWVGDCKKIVVDGYEQCIATKTLILQYFTDADGFFYRPGTKLYFYVMYALFWLNNGAYHVASVLIHFVNGVLVFLLAEKILKKKVFALLTAVFFLVLSGNFESIFWISSTGHLVTATFFLFSIYLSILFAQKKNWVFFIGSVIAAAIAPMFHEYGIVVPCAVIVTDIILFYPDIKKYIASRWYYLVYLLLIPAYLFLRGSAHSHWFNGDYSYNLAHLPYNLVGNFFGYFVISLIGEPVMTYYEQLRTLAKTMPILVIVVGFILLALICLGFWFGRKLPKQDRQALLMGVVLFVAPLIIFVGLGNITFRYAYLASAGVMLLLVYLLQKLTTSGKKTNKIAATLLVGAFSVIFIGYHLMEIQRLNKDWKTAGDITNNVMTSFNDTYSKQDALPPNPVFYFVDVPIRHKSAWVFPVGLKDALWFPFQNTNLNVVQEPSLDLALQAAEGSTSAKIFQFQKDGNVEEVTKTEVFEPVVTPESSK